MISKNLTIFEKLQLAIMQVIVKLKEMGPNDLAEEYEERLRAIKHDNSAISGLQSMSEIFSLIQDMKKDLRDSLNPNFEQLNELSYLLNVSSALDSELVQ